MNHTRYSFAAEKGLGLSVGWKHTNGYAIFILERMCNKKNKENVFCASTGRIQVRLFLILWLVGFDNGVSLKVKL